MPRRVYPEPRVVVKVTVDRLLRDNIRNHVGWGNLNRAYETAINAIGDYLSNHPEDGLAAILSGDLHISRRTNAHIK